MWDFWFQVSTDGRHDPLRLSDWNCWFQLAPPRLPALLLTARTLRPVLAPLICKGEHACPEQPSSWVPLLTCTYSPHPLPLLLQAAIWGRSQSSWETLSTASARFCANETIEWNITVVYPLRLTRHKSNRTWVHSFWLLILQTCASALSSRCLCQNISSNAGRTKQSRCSVTPHQKATWEHCKSCRYKKFCPLSHVFTFT